MQFVLTPAMLLQAYRQGIFPMAEGAGDPRLYWFDPEQRGVLPLDGFHISRSLARRIRAGVFRATFDSAFAQVIDGCAERPSTWINSEIRRLFLDLHALGQAHSLEVWSGADLVGGVYGVRIGGCFCGESMFSRRTDASKAALAWLVAHLRACGFTLFDTQYLTPHLASLGGVEIPRRSYRARLRAALDVTPHDPRTLPLPSADQIVQRSTQMS
jgi:leucyl/phenylalanyl-tRNA---protein transferase